MTDCENPPYPDNETFIANSGTRHLMVSDGLNLLSRVEPNGQQAVVKCHMSDHALGPFRRPSAEILNRDYPIAFVEVRHLDCTFLSRMEAGFESMLPLDLVY
jgi:hypothetical protein